MTPARTVVFLLIALPLAAAAGVLYEYYFGVQYPPPALLGDPFAGEESLIEPELLRGYGDSLAARGEHEGAIEAYTLALSLAPEQHRILVARGKSYGEMGRYEEAIRDFTVYLAANPGDAFAYSFRGSAYGAIGLHERALKDLTRGLELDPGALWVLKRRAEVYRALGRHPEAIADLDEVLRRMPAFRGAYRDRGICRYQLDEMEAAREDLNKALEVNGTDYLALMMHALVSRLLDRLDDAELDYSRVLDHNSQQPGPLLQRGIVRGALGRYREAIVDLRAARDLQPLVETPRVFLSLAHMSLGHYRAALVEDMWFVLFRHMKENRRREILERHSRNRELSARLERTLVRALLARTPGEAVDLFAEGALGASASAALEVDSPDGVMVRRSMDGGDGAIPIREAVEGLYLPVASWRGVRAAGVRLLDRNASNGRYAVSLWARGLGPEGEMASLSSRLDLDVPDVAEASSLRSARLRGFRQTSFEIVSAERPLLAERPIDIGSLVPTVPDDPELFRPRPVAISDMDGDGFLDVAFAGPDGVRLLRGGPDFSFREARDRIPERPVAGPIAWLDADGDGDEDLLAGGRLFLNESGERFRDHTSESGLDLVGAVAYLVADMDRDGDLDIFCPSRSDDASSGLPDRLWENDGRGHFADVSTARGMADLLTRPNNAAGALWFFADAGTDPDLYVANDLTCRLLANKHGYFADRTRWAGVGHDRMAMGAAATDLDGDGRAELFVSNPTFAMVGFDVESPDYTGNVYATTVPALSGNTLWSPSEAAKPFTDRAGLWGLPTDGWTVGAAFPDLNADGRPDAVLLHRPDLEPETAVEVRLLLNDGKRLVDASSAVDMDPLLAPRAVVTGDFDRDGYEDVLIIDADGHPLLLENRFPRKSQVLSLRLRAAGGNPDAIGASVTVHLPGGGRRHYACFPQNGFGVQGPPEIQMGLGAASIIERVEVVWPSGAATRYRDLPANRRVILTEGKNEPEVRLLRE